MNAAAGPPATARQQIRSLFLGGLLPVIAYAIIEDRFGIFWGLIAGMVLGAGEILYEWRTRGKVDPITWGGNGLILILGGVSLFTQEGVWFKLQPALIEGAMGIALLGSVMLGRPLLWSLALKQGAVRPEMPEALRARMRQGMSGFTFRLSLFMFLHAGLAAWAALHWSTAAWSILKGVGFTLSFIVYLVVETFVLRYRISNPRSH